MNLPWEEPGAPDHVVKRQPVMEIPSEPGIRHDLPRRRRADELPRGCQGVSFGIGVMSHRGASNGRLSVLLSSIPENYPVVVSSDSVAEEDFQLDVEVAEWHGAEIQRCTPWGGRARNAIHTMEVAPWERVLFLCDDVWLFPEAVRDALGWFVRLENVEIPLATLTVPGWETYAPELHKRWGFETWGQCLKQPEKFEAVPPNPAFRMCPALHKNPFGACMIVSRRAYEDLGGFATEYWAHDDVWNHKVWTSGKWVNVAYHGRGYMHLGAQSWHHGESAKYVGSFEAATGMRAEESGKRQAEAMVEWGEGWVGERLLKLGGTRSV
jgi:hypothetical protein